jgi:hypothetical protein
MIEGAVLLDCAETGGSWKPFCETFVGFFTHAGLFNSVLRAAC